MSITATIAIDARNNADAFTRNNAAARAQREGTDLYTETELAPLPVTAPNPGYASEIPAFPGACQGLFFGEVSVLPIRARDGVDVHIPSEPKGCRDYHITRIGGGEIAVNRGSDAVGSVREGETAFQGVLGAYRPWMDRVVGDLRRG